MTIPKPPAGLDARGRRLWKSTHEQHPEINDAEREVLAEACRVCDRLERLDKLCRTEPPVIEGRMGLIANPAYSEARQQQNLLKQLVASLRIPDAVTGRRPPQRGIRQQPLVGAAGATVTTLRDRLRATGTTR